MSERIEAYGVVLRRLGHGDIEMVRRWRNDPEVSRYMAFREEITPDMQERWFRGLDPRTQFFYVIEQAGRALGLANLKDYDAARASAEGGIFIADPAARDGQLGLAAILALYDWGFESLSLDEIVAHILADNPRAIRFNQALGFRIDPGQEGVANPVWRVGRQAYFAATARLKGWLAAR